VQCGKSALRVIRAGEMSEVYAAAPQHIRRRLRHVVARRLRVAGPFSRETRRAALESAFDIDFSSARPSPRSER
jgi:hypothetical protein